MREMSVFILNLQTEDLKENPNQEIKPKYQNGKKQQPGLIGQILPPHLVKDADLKEDLETTFALMRYCKQASFRTVRLSNSQRVNPHGEKVVNAVLR